MECYGYTTCCAFNSYGTLFAVGCRSGNILIWDYLTRSLAKIIRVSLSAVIALSWSQNGKYLVCASSSCSIFVFDVLHATCEKTYSLPSLPIKVQFHPKLDNVFLACPVRHSAVVVDLKRGSRTIPSFDANDRVIGSFDADGSHLYIGKSTGKLYVYSYADFTLKASFKVTQQALKSISFSKCGRYYIVNSADRILRVYSSEEVLICGVNGEPEPLQKLQDNVCRAGWIGCCFSGDGKFICAGALNKNELFIWKRELGNLVEVLRWRNGRGFQDIDWHPTDPSIICLSISSVTLWKPIPSDNWPAFIPGFKELDDNIVDDERDLDFYISNGNRKVVKQNKDDEDDELLEVDVVTVSPNRTNSELQKNALLYLPAFPEPGENDQD
ncbi:retinoblastoma-binding protein 5 homolog isoform X2 [Nilaparvata lugens]|nr:retinoblastoma-binding protein 5 homolog isoform X2 [Nilaparvata lugens]